MIDFSNVKVILLICSYSIVILWGIFLNYLYKRKFLISKNFQGKEVFASYGLIAYPSIALGIIILYAFGNIDINTVMNYLIIMSIMWLSGAVDDLFGDKENRGFKGHISALIKEKKITTGFIKIIAGIISGIVAVNLFGGDNILRSVCAFLLIPLSSNTVNLFDLRPGRAMVSFFICAIAILLICSFNMYDWGILSIVFIVSITAYIWDRMGQSMMGDSYSNVIGAFLGIIIIMNAPTWFWIAAIIINIIIQLFSERYSLTKTIEGNKFLNILDRFTGVR